MTKSKNVGRGFNLPVLDPDDIRTKYQKWEDFEFIEAATHLSYLDLESKTEFIYKHTKYQGLFNTQRRVIDGKEYLYGIDLNDYATGQYVAWYFINAEKLIRLEDFKKNILFRLDQCQDGEKISFLEHEVARIGQAVTSDYDKSESLYFQKNGFAYGYLSEKRKENNWNLYHLTNGSYSSNQLQISSHDLLTYCWAVIRGAASYYLELELLKMIENARKVSRPVYVTQDTITPFKVEDYIEKLSMNLFISAEKKATNDTGKFPTPIRCAAFCELLYNRKYLKNDQKNRRIIIASFAKVRYGHDINVQMQSGKKDDRKKHQEKIVSGLPPLKKAFE